MDTAFGAPPGPGEAAATPSGPRGSSRCWGQTEAVSVGSGLGPGSGREELTGLRGWGWGRIHGTGRVEVKE